MMIMHSKYDNMPKNGMNYALKCTDNHVISSISCMLLQYKIQNNRYVLDLQGKVFFRPDKHKITIVERASSRIRNYTQLEGELKKIEMNEYF